MCSNNESIISTEPPYFPFIWNVIGLSYLGHFRFFKSPWFNNRPPECSSDESGLEVECSEWLQYTRACSGWRHKSCMGSRFLRRYSIRQVSICRPHACKMIYIYKLNFDIWKDASNIHDINNNCLLCWILISKWRYLDCGKLSYVSVCKFKRHLFNS